MSSTIFCVFEQQDLADLAMGHVRRIRGVQSIHYIGMRDHSGSMLRGGDGPGVVSMAAAPGNMNFGAVWRNADGDAPARGLPSPPVSVRIVCADSARTRVEAMLVNMHAHRITVQR